MKISVYTDSCVQTVVSAADLDTENTIEVSDAEWAAFNEAEDRYEDFLARFRQQQADERQKAMGEIGQLRARLSQLEARLGLAPAPAPMATAPAKKLNPVDETDAGHGASQGPWMGSMSTAELRAAHEEMRNHTAEKRRKLR